MARILIVDDSATEVQSLRAMLEAGGYETLEARSAEEGISTARSEKPDAVLMDIVMPGLNGFQAMRQMGKESDTKDIPVIVVTTKDGETDRIWSMRQGAVGYLVKPVTGPQLLEAVQKALA
ncbi:MAG: response regulator [Gammaproteobacteria bacterium]|nr:response regulator [Gammaproteobacteria bacterium]